MRNRNLLQIVVKAAGLVAAVAFGTHCIIPQAQCPATDTASSTSSSSSTSSASSTKVNAPPAVKPTGPLLSDGASEKIQGIDPPGSWFVFNDKSAKGVMTPASTGEFASSGIVNGAIHTQGKGFTDWGGGIGFNFAGGDSLTPVDASGYGGLSFTASGSTPMHVGLATVATMPEFGVCTKCYDHFATDINDLSSTPKTYTFKWSQLKAAGWGAPRATLDPHTLVGFNFTSKGAAPWDFSIKDIKFVP